MKIPFDKNMDSRDQSIASNKNESVMNARNFITCTNCQEGYIYKIVKKKRVRVPCPERKGTRVVMSRYC